MCEIKKDGDCRQTCISGCITMKSSKVIITVGPTVLGIIKSSLATGMVPVFFFKPAVFFRQAVVELFFI